MLEHFPVEDIRNIFIDDDDPKSFHRVTMTGSLVWHVGAHEINGMYKLGLVVAITWGTAYVLWSE